MNKTYIKRQITLHKLGLPMSEDIKEYYDYFHSLIGNVNNLEKITHNDYPDSIFWKRNGKVILKFYNKEGWFRFIVDHDTIWLKFEEKYPLSNKYISDLFGIMLEEDFKLRPIITSFDWLTNNLVLGKLSNKL